MNANEDKCQRMKLPMIPTYMTLHPQIHSLATLCSCGGRVHLPISKPSKNPNPPKRKTNRRGAYSSLLTRSLICNSDESSVVEQTLVRSALWLFLLLLFLDFGSL